MSNLRVFGTEISGNRQKTQELSPETRAAICASVAAGQSPSAVAKAFHVHRATIYRTVKRSAELSNFKSKPRTVRPKVLTAREERYLVRLARRFPKLSWKALVHLHGTQVSRSTLQRILKRYNLRKWVAKQRPKLTADHARQRRAFCRNWRGREEELVAVSKPVFSLLILPAYTLTLGNLF